MPDPSTNLIPRKRVGARGPVTASIMFIGEAPGQTENALGLPFVGPAGSELDRYARWGGVWISDCYITNLVKVWPLVDPRRKQLAPSAEQVAADTAELLAEIEIVRPQIIVAVGAYAARWFLGDGFHSAHRDHGIPRRVAVGLLGGGSHHCTLLPVIHPSAGLHSDREQVNIQEDFLQLGRLVRGQIPPHPVVDEFAGCERYEYLTDADDGVRRLADILAGRTVIAIDTEGSIADPWCLTFSVEPGVAYLVRATEPECLAALNRHINAYHAVCTVICHYLAHDIPVAAALGVDLTARRMALNLDGSLALRCTMSEAYLLGTEPKGLKPLAWRLCGMEMESYEDLVGPTEQRIVFDYLRSVWEQLSCGHCGGTGAAEKYKVIDVGCADCGGTGRIQGARAGTTKWCSCVKTKDKCRACIDGLLVPLADREFIFDSAKQQWRWKQPQSMAKWIRRRVWPTKMRGDGSGTDDDETAIDSINGDDTGVEAAISGLDAVEAGAGEDEPPSAYFKTRKDWRALVGRPDLQYVEAVTGRMPKTTLSDVPDQDRVTHYACRDADAALRAAPILEGRLAALNLLPIREQDAAFIPMLSRMEQLGMKTNRPHFEELHTHLAGRMEEARNRLSAILGERTNPNSPKLAELLFTDLGLPSIKLTKSGKRDSLDDDVIGALKAKLRKRNADDGLAKLGLRILDCISDYREVLKIDDYADKILEHADRNDRIHTVLSYTTAATGRLTSSEPINLQTLPNPDNYPEECPAKLNYGVRVRGGFVEDDGWVLIGCDYSQIEMVVGAHLTRDPGMMKVFNEGLDLHKYAASIMFGIAYDQVPKRLRTQTKPLNFGAFYGLSAMGLQAQFASLPAGAIEKTESECQELIDRYYAAFPGVIEWKCGLWEQAESDGFVRDLFGRIRWVPGLRSSIRKVRSAAEREAANHPIQSTANGIIRIASRNLWEHTLPMLHADGIECDVVMQTHDENVARCRQGNGELVAVMMAGTMRQAVTLSVPIKVEAKIGRNLYEVK